MDRGEMLKLHWVSFERLRRCKIALKETKDGQLYLWCSWLCLGRLGASCIMWDRFRWLGVFCME